MVYRSRHGLGRFADGPTWPAAWAVGAANRSIDRAKKFLRLPPTEKRQVLHAGLLVVAFRLGLWCVPYRLLRRAADVRCGQRDAAANAAAPQRIALQVAQVARLVPLASCLTQALTTLVLMRRAGLVPELRIGAARDELGQFKAHAWVEYEGRIVIGDIPGLAGFVRLQQVQVRSVA